MEENKKRRLKQFFWSDIVDIKKLLTVGLFTILGVCFIVMYFVEGRQGKEYLIIGAFLVVFGSLVLIFWKNLKNWIL